MHSKGVIDFREAVPQRVPGSEDRDHRDGMPGIALNWSGTAVERAEYLVRFVELWQSQP